MSVVERRKWLGFFNDAIWREIWIYWNRKKTTLMAPLRIVQNSLRIIISNIEIRIEEKFWKFLKRVVEGGWGCFWFSPLIQLHSKVHFQNTSKHAFICLAILSYFTIFLYNYRKNAFCFFMEKYRILIHSVIRFED